MDLSILDRYQNGKYSSFEEREEVFVELIASCNLQYVTAETFKLAKNTKYIVALTSWAHHNLDLLKELGHWLIDNPTSEHFYAFYADRLTRDVFEICFPGFSYGTTPPYFSQWKEGQCVKSHYASEAVTEIRKLIQSG